MTTILNEDNDYPFEHVVVLMLENRSFDNLLGYLYEDGLPEGKAFEGLQGKELSNPASSSLLGNEKGENEVIKVHEADSYNQPYPDPGEVYPHVNTQLFNELNSNNIGKSSIGMTEPYNLPDPVPNEAPMSGFVNDYINTLKGIYEESLGTCHIAEEYEHISPEQYKVIMQCFKPDKVSVLATLAKEFSVFDHWHCSVPSQTWCNRSFWHAATSGGYVINPSEGEGDVSEKLAPMGRWIRDVWSKPTLFSRMKDKGVGHKVYSGSDWCELLSDPTKSDTDDTCDIEQSAEDKILLQKLSEYKEYLSGTFSLTQLIHGPNNVENIGFMTDFYQDLDNESLAQYSFIEPKIFGEHNDQHPCAYNDEQQVGTVLLGEKLIWDIYNAIRTSSYKDKILFIITHDEHGGCYDHVSPPSAVPPSAVPSEENMEGKCDFKFDRLGVRVPMVMVSSYIDQNTIMNEVFDHTAFIHSMSEKWNLSPLTDRDKNASSFSGVFSKNKRQTDWPEIPEPVIHSRLEDYSKKPLNDLQKSAIKSLLTLLNNTYLSGDNQIVIHDFLEKLKESSSSRVP